VAAESRDARIARRTAVLEAVSAGHALKRIIREVSEAHGVARRTVRRDLTELGADAAARLRDEGALGVELDQAIGRMRERAVSNRDTKVAQRADEVLLRFLGEQLSATRLAKLGHQIEEHEAALAEIERRRLSAQAELAEAEAELARVRAENVAAPLVVVLRDLGAGVSDEDLAAASPTLTGRE
jgi:hypothetical protein